MAHLDIMLLGRFEARLDGERIDQFSYDKVRALLAYLAVESDRLHPRESIAGLLWAEYPEQRARQNLSQALLTLRKAIDDDAADPPFLYVTRYALQLNRECDYALDVRTFLSLIETCDRHTHATLAGCEPCLGRLAEATALYRGDFLATFSLPDSPAFEEWALLERERLSRQAVVALDKLTTSRLARGDYAEALEHGRRHVLLDPWQEGAHRQVMLALAMMGQRHAAVEQYERCRTALEADLGVSPEPETLALYQQIRSGDLVAPTGSTPSQPTRAVPASPRDHASPGREGTPAARRPGPAPALRPSADRGATRETPADDRPPRHNLPAQLAPFIGRQGELAALGKIFCDPDNRLLSLVGPGGSGKSRLAIEAARRCLDSFDDGVFLISLAPLQSRDAIVPMIAAAVGLQLRPGDAPEARLADYLRDKVVLLILDNFEHVLDGLDIVLDLLSEAPNLRIVLTSRVRTNAQSEVFFVVEGMDVPDPRARLEPQEPSDAMALFVAGAQRNHPEFRLTQANVADVRRICELVNGMPLAILLAASWVPLLSPAEIADRLGSEFGASADFLRADWQDVPVRHRSLRAVFDHAWQLLTIREKAVFEALSIFRGGFTRLAAKEVAGVTLWELRSLINKSFVSVLQEGRYEIHELMRQYASEKLEIAPVARDEVRTQHSQHYLSMMTRWARELQTAEQQHALEEMAVEIENARLAWAWLLETHELADLCPALRACCLFFDWRVRYEEGIRFCQLSLEMTETDGLDIAADPALRSEAHAGVPLRARAMAWLGRFQHLLGQSEVGEAWLQQALDLVNSVQEPSPPLLATQAFVLEQLGAIAAVHDRDAALDLYRDALMYYQEAGDKWGTANAYYDLGTIGHQTSRYIQSKTWYEESLALRRELGDRRGIADALIWLGFNAVRQGHAEEGVRLIQEGADIRQAIGDRPGVALATFQLGQALLWSGQFERSHSLVAESIRRYEGLGDRYHYAYANVFLGCIKGFVGDYDGARAQLARGIALAQSGGFRREEAFGQFCTATLELAQGRPKEGLELADMAVAAYLELGQRDELSWVHGVRTLLLNALGRRTEAWAELARSLEISVQLRSFGTVLWGLPAASRLLCDDGEPLKALEIHTLLQRYPMIGNTVWHQDVTGRAIEAAANACEHEAVASAREAGHARELQDVVAEVLDIVMARVPQ